MFDRKSLTELAQQIGLSMQYRRFLAGANQFAILGRRS